MWNFPKISLMCTRAEKIRDLSIHTMLICYLPVTFHPDTHAAQPDNAIWLDIQCRKVLSKLLLLLLTSHSPPPSPSAFNLHFRSLSWYFVSPWRATVTTSVSLSGSLPFLRNDCRSLRVTIKGVPELVAIHQHWSTLIVYLCPARTPSVLSMSDCKWVALDPDPPCSQRHSPIRI